MTVYGWTPASTCYTPTAPTTATVQPAAVPTGATAAPATTGQQAASQTAIVAANCQAPTWWYSLLALATIAGFAARGKA